MACWTPTAGSRTLITCRRQDVFLFLLRGAPVAPTSNPRNGCSGRRFAAASPGDNAAVLERISCCASGAELEAGLAQFNGSYSNPASLDGYSIRIDQVINSKLNLFGRYNYSPSSLDQRGPLFPSGSVLSTTESLSSSIQTFKLGVTGIINSQISNEVRANYSNNRFGTKYALDNFGGAVPLPDSLLFPTFFSSAKGLFQFPIVGAGEFAQGKFATDEQRQVNFVDNLSVTTGSYQLKFGVDYRWRSPFTSPLAYAGTALMPRPNVVPGAPLELFGSQYPGGKIFNKQLSPYRPKGSRAISGAMCCGVSELHNWIVLSSGNFSSPRGWGFASEPSSSTSSTIQTSAALPTPSKQPTPWLLDTNVSRQSGRRLERRFQPPLPNRRPPFHLWWPSGTLTVSAKLQISARQNCRR